MTPKQDPELEYNITKCTDATKLNIFFQWSP